VSAAARTHEVSARPVGALETLGLLVRSLRPRQWPKNGVVLLSLVFAQQLGQPEQVVRAVAATLLFCLLSGTVYLSNDLRDVEHDRLHPRKRRRPIASGRLSPTVAVVATVLLAGLALAGAFALSTGFGWVALGYLGLQAVYVALVKHVVILDVLVLALGFVLRAVAGAVVVGVPISPWLYVCALLLALFLALGKRRQELVSLTADGVAGGEVGPASLASRHRPALEEYTVGLLDQLIQVVTTCLVLAYSLYTFSAENLPRNHAMMLTVPFVLYGLFRYLYLVNVRGEGGAPEDVLLRDRGIAICVALWGASCVAILYLSPRVA
jgi:4-hydroxybenzoate polyprenyltransferase